MEKSEEQYMMSGQESLQVISAMIAKAKTSYHDRGTLSMLWGVVITFCSLVTWSQIRFGYRLPVDIWLLTVVAVIPTVILSIRENKKRKVKSYDQAAMDYVWTCFGISMFLVIHSNISVFQTFASLKDLIEKAGMERPKVSFSDYSSAYMLILYGIPTLVTAGIKQFRPMLLGGIICWSSALIVVYTPLEIDMLLMAVSAAMAWLVPGIILYRKHLSRKAVANV